MKLIYSGKTKDVYEVSDHEVMLKFKDDMTGKDGVFDPGENQIGLTVEGMGKVNLSVATLFFNYLKEKNIKTHYVSSDLEAGTMIVERCRPFGKGLEVIFRNYATGSFIRRYGLYATEMMELDDYVEVTLKDDKRQDPLITKEALIALNILTAEQYDDLAKQTKVIAHLVGEVLKEKGLDLIDIKFEYGVNKDGEVLLIDEISSGNMRVYKNGEKLDPEAISNAVLGK